MNSIFLCGTVNGECRFSHAAYGEKFFVFQIDVKRTSGVVDKIPCIASEPFVRLINNGERISIDGEIRTRRKVNEDNSISSMTFVFVRNVLDPSDKDENCVNAMEAVICRVSDIRTVSNGERELVEFLCASHRDGRAISDYLHCIAWRRNAKMISAALNVGDKINFSGRLQSRDYVKRYEDGRVEEKTTYEVSIASFEMFSEENEGGDL